MLEKINQIFGDIKDAIQEKGVEISDCESPENYADRIMQINVCSDDDCSGEGGETSNNGYVYFFFPAFIASKTQPDTPNNTIRSLFTVTSGNYIQTLNYPAGWGSATAVMSGNKENPVWISYCIVAIKNNSPSYYLNWTTPMCIGYPYTNSSSDQWIDDGGEHTGSNYYTRTFLIYTELPSTSYSLSTPVGGTWNTTTNLLEGSITSTTSTGTVTWSVNNNHTSGMYTYISIGTFGSDGNIIGTWSDPFCINATNGKDGKDGADGRSGADGVNVEFIFKLCTDLEAFRLLETPDSQSYTGYIPTGWTAVPSGIDCSNYKVEACCIRKLESNGRWGTWNGPIIWAICGSSGDGSGSGSGEGSVSGGNFTGTAWYKLSNQSSGITTPALNQEDPTTAGAGSWSKIPHDPTSSLPYLWCFIQINYSYPLANGFKYSRSDAFIVRHYEYTTAAEISALAEMLNITREDIYNKMTDSESNLIELNHIMNDIKSDLESKILLSHLNDTTSRVDTIEKTGTTELTGDGLWGMLTSYDGTGTDGTKKKAFSDIVLNAENAKTTLNNGAALVNSITNAGLTIDGIGAKIEQSASKSYVTGKIDATLWNLDSSSISTAVSKGQKGWKQTSTEKLYPYTHHFEPDPDDVDCFNMTGHTLEDFEEYMQSSQNNPYTTNDENDVYYGQTIYPSDGPFELITVINEFSTIKQTANSIEASVQNSIKQLRNTNDSSDIQLYDKFESDYNTHLEQNPSYINTPYNQSAFANLYEYWLKMDHVPQYEVIKIGDALSDIIQTTDKISSKVGRVNHVWRRLKTDGAYKYKQYACPNNQSASQYEDSVKADTSNPGNIYKSGSKWELYDWSDQMTVIDQLDNEITLGVKNTSMYWVKTSRVNDTLAQKAAWREGIDHEYIRYDYWKDDWKTARLAYYDASDYETHYKNYEDWVAFSPNSNSAWTQMPLNNSMAAIDVKSDQITQSVENLKGEMSEVKVAADYVKLASSKTDYVWESDSGDEYYAYDYFRDAWLATDPSSKTDNAYETWVTSSDNDIPIWGKVAKTQLSGITVQHDKIFLGLGDDKENYDAAITIEKDENDNGKIVLDAANTIVNGNLKTSLIQVINNPTSSTDTINGTIITPESITTNKLSSGVITDVVNLTVQNINAGNVTANTLESIDEGNTRRVLIEDGKAEFYLWDSTMNSGVGGWRKRIDIGITGTSNNDLVLRFFDSTTGKELYNLGPAGLTDVLGGIVKDSDGIIIDSDGNWF